MFKLTPVNLANFLKSTTTSAPSRKLVIVGILKDATASSVQFSAHNFASWLTLPTALIEEATCLGVVQGIDPDKEEHFPLFSIVLKTPESQSEHFLYDLVFPPFFMASKLRNQAESVS